MEEVGAAPCPPSKILALTALVVVCIVTPLKCRALNEEMSPIYYLKDD